MAFAGLRVLRLLAEVEVCGVLEVRVSLEDFAAVELADLASFADLVDFEEPPSLPDLAVFAVFAAVFAELVFAGEVAVAVFSLSPAFVDTPFAEDLELRLALVCLGEEVGSAGSTWVLVAVLFFVTKLILLDGPARSCPSTA